MLDELILKDYTNALENLKKQEDIATNGFICYREMIRRILSIDPITINEIPDDMFISLKKINYIVETELYNLKRLNKHIVESKKN